MQMLVVDTETSGTDPDVHSILSLGAVIWHDDPTIPRDTFDIMIAEPCIVSEAEAMKVNKIDLEFLKKAGTAPRGAVSLFHNFLRKHWQADEKIVLAGHCVDFDAGFIKRLFKQAGVRSEYDKLFSHRTMDTSGIGRFLVLSGKLELEPKSDALFDFFGIDQGDMRHTALGDALATALLLDRLIEFTSAS